MSFINYIPEWIHNTNRNLLDYGFSHPITNERRVVRMVSKKLKVGEKYLSVQVLGDNIKLAAFEVPKEERENNPKLPNYRGNGIAIWVNEKKAPKDNEDEVL